MHNDGVCPLGKGKIMQVKGGKGEDDDKAKSQPL
jgi:hypothetical protein